MTDESSPNDAKKIWQNQKTEGIRMSLEEVRRKAGKFERKVFWENARIYFSLLIGVALLSYLLVVSNRYPTNVLIPLGDVLILVAILLVSWQTHNRSRFRRVPADMGIVSCLDFYRQELERRRDLHRSLWRWAFGPGSSGVIIMTMGMAHLNPNHAWQPGWILIGIIALSVLMGICVWKQSTERARKLQDEIDELSALWEPR